MQENPEYEIKKRRFDAYCEEKILPALKDLEKTRKKYLKIFIVIGLFAVLWLGYAFYNIAQNLGQKNSANFSSYGLTSCLAILFACWPLFGYYKKSKESLLPLIAGFFGDFSYISRGMLPESLIKKSLIVKKYDRMEADDSFSGKYDDVSVSFAEYVVSKKSIRQNNDIRQEYYKPIRRGIFFIARMNKNFTGQTIVVKDKGWLNKLAHYKNMKRAGLESPEFEKLFEVYTTDQIEARYILTSVMLEYMTALKKIFSKIEFSFFDEHVFINIETKKNLFECSCFFRSIINKKRITENFRELYLLFSIIDTLKLNQKKLL